MEKIECLKVGDVVSFFGKDYRVIDYHRFRLLGISGDTAALFKKLRINDFNNFAANILGYNDYGEIFPICRSLEGLTKLVNALKEKEKEMNQFTTTATTATTATTIEQKRIIGYIAPISLFGGSISIGTIYTRLSEDIYGSKDIRGGIEYITYLPKEIVETWEPVYEPESLKVFKVGSFELTVKDNKVFHRGNDETIFVKQLKEAIRNFKNNVRCNLRYPVIVQDITFSSTGCEGEPSKLSEWQKVFDEIN